MNCLKLERYRDAPPWLEVFDVTDPLDKEVDDLLEVAASWHARLDLGTAKLKDFERWRDADPRHAAAFARIIGTDESFEDVKFRLSDELDEFEEPPVSMTRRHWLGGAVAGAGAVVLGGGGVFALMNRHAHADTRVGERQSLSLSNDARLDINTDSKVSWRIGKQTTDVWLDRGEIGLTLLPVEGRACRIHAAGLVVVVRDGMLNIRLRRDGADVTLLDGPGAVATSDERQADVFLPLARGQAVLLKDGAGEVRSLTAEGLDVIKAWRSDEMLFTGQSLAVVVEEYNRYLTRKLVIRDAGLSNLRLGGRFNVHDTTAFLAALKSTFGIRSVDDGKVIALTR